jgi:NADH:ubiquinone oxidoreductase subunit 5 (subunit L)/multisubunit Na+/H+ antiporter MnhA subunit
MEFFKPIFFAIGILLFLPLSIFIARFVRAARAGHGDQGWIIAIVLSVIFIASYIFAWQWLKRKAVSRQWMDSFNSRERGFLQRQWNELVYVSPARRY